MMSTILIIPKEITGDPPPIPMLSTNQIRIFKRVFNKFIISEAFRNTGFARAELSSSTHGEMGLPTFWIANKRILVEWLTSKRNELRTFFNLLSFGTELVWNDIDANSYYTGNAFLSEVDQKAEDNNIPGEEVSDRLAEGGILPMFGMPTSVKNLYHGFDKSKLEMLSINRDQSMAITEFAPGSEKTKDKAILKSIGITPDLRYILTPPVHYPGKSKDELLPFLFTGYMKKCSNCNIIETQHVSIDFDNGQTFDLPVNIECSNCGMPSLKFPIVIPAAYRTDFRKGRDDKEGNDVIISRPPIYAVPNKNLDPERVLLNNFCKSLSAIDTTWRINNNGTEYFYLERKTVRKNYFLNNVSHSHELPDQWVLPAANIQYLADQTIDTTNAITTAFAANKTTEVFRIQPIQTDPGIFSNMFDSVLQSSSIKSAVYSAAFILQRAGSSRSRC